jgi:hypothetical protein
MPVRFGNARAQDVGVSQFAANGMLWMAGTGKVDVPNNNYLKASIALAADASKPVTIIRCGLTTTGAAFTSFFINPTTNLPSTVKTPNNAVMDGRAYAGKVTCKADAGALAMSGGTATSVSIGNGAAGRSVVDGPFILRPGFMIGFDTQSAGAFSLAFNIYWVELP